MILQSQVLYITWLVINIINDPPKSSALKHSKLNIINDPPKSSPVYNLVVINIINDPPKSSFN